jgi:hypothetical protein
MVLLNMPRADAEAVDWAVQRWAALGEGVFLLYVGASYVVEFLIDVADDAMHIERVRRC